MREVIRLQWILFLSFFILFSSFDQGNKPPTKELQYYLNHISILTKQGGKWKTPNREYKPEDEWSRSHYGYEYSKGISEYYLKLKITAYYPNKMQWYVLTDGYYTWDFKNNRVNYHSYTPNGTFASGYSLKLTEEGMTLSFTITSIDGKQIQYKETETFNDTSIVAQNSERKGRKWEIKQASQWSRQIMPPANLKIVYNAVIDKTCGTYEIFSMNLDGSDKRNISNWKGADWAYATFGDKIYFVSDRDTTSRLWFLYEMDVNGNNVRKVFNQRLEDSYIGINSVGSKMILKPIRKERNTFLIIDITKGVVIDSLILPFAGIADPIYLNGDKQIVFRGNKVKKEPEELFIMDANGTNIKQLTKYPSSDTTAKWYETHTGTPVWNEKEKALTYFSKQNSNHSIYSIKLDGTDQRKLTDDLFNEGWHAWTKDGNFLVYDGSDLEDKNFDIYLKDVQSGFIKRLTTDSIVEQAPLFIQSKK
ncbi:MAG: PD40 domain-containing protein [Bacteroidia bacterium]|nr:PD40 domain-containing protein [Bacteroidia bacterium]